MKQGHGIPIVGSSKVFECGGGGTWDSGTAQRLGLLLQYVKSKQQLSLLLVSMPCPNLPKKFSDPYGTNFSSMLNEAEGGTNFGGVLILGRCVSHVIFTFHSVFLSPNCIEHNSESNFELQEVVCWCFQCKEADETGFTLEETFTVCLKCTLDLFIFRLLGSLKGVLILADYKIGPGGL